MTNEEKINLIGQKILILSSNLDTYQAELQTLKIQLLQLQQQNPVFQKQSIAPPPLIHTPVPKVEDVPEIKTVPVEVKQDPIPVVPAPVHKIEPLEKPATQIPLNTINQSNPTPQFQFKAPVFTPPAPAKKTKCGKRSKSSLQKTGPGFWVRSFWLLVLVS